MVLCMCVCVCVCVGGCGCGCESANSGGDLKILQLLKKIINIIIHFEIEQFKDDSAPLTVYSY